MRSEVTPLRITATVTKPVIVRPGGLNIASLLAWARAQEMDLPPPREHPVPIEIPVLCAWRDRDGWPLWAATDMRPEGESHEHRQWLHKRYPADRADLADRMKVSLVAGPFKERRIPVHAIACQTWVGEILATDASAVERLVSMVQAIGARAAAGFGAVHAWRVEPCDIDLEAVLSRRSVPVESALRSGQTKIAPWTPPYWHAALWSECVMGDAPCS